MPVPADFVSSLGTLSPERIAREEGVWRATNIEIVDYLGAVRRLRVNVAGTRILNPSARPVWVSWDGAPREIPAGALVSL